LIANRRASEDTRFNTPGLFSTYATSVCMFSSIPSGVSGKPYPCFPASADSVRLKTICFHTHL
jgi:hypothetical protein